MLLRLSALEYLGVVTSRLRKDAVQSKLRIDYIDSIVTAIREEEEKEGMNNTLAESDSEDEDGKAKNGDKDLDSNIFCVLLPKSSTQFIEN